MKGLVDIPQLDQHYDASALPPELGGTLSEDWPTIRGVLFPPSTPARIIDSEHSFCSGSAVLVSVSPLASPTVSRTQQFDLLSEECDRISDPRRCSQWLSAVTLLFGVMSAARGLARYRQSVLELEAAEPPTLGV
eukprot:2235553-Rhodomonas_salina.1